MKNFYATLILFFFICTSNTIHAQIFNGDIFLSTQQEVDDFAFTEVTGNVVVTGVDIENLDALSILTIVGGNLDIKTNPLLTTIDNFGNLISIGGNLIIDSNALLNTISEFNFSKIGASILLKSNPILDEVTSFNNVDSIGIDLSITFNDSLKNISGFSNLVHVNRQLFINNNPVLINMPLFDNLSTVGQNLALANNDSLVAVSEFSNLTFIGVDLRIINNTKIEEISGFNMLSTIGYSLLIQANNELKLINGFSNLNLVGDLYFDGGISITDNKKLTQVIGMDMLTEVGVFIYISGNDDLIELPDFPMLSIIGNSLRLENNLKLTDLSGFNNLNSIGSSFFGGLLIIEENTLLNTISGFQNLSLIVGSISITDNPSLTELSGLNTLTNLGLSNNISGNISILRNNQLNSIDGFNGLLTMDNLSIQDNTSLMNLNGFSLLENIRDLTLEDNPMLSTISGFTNLLNINQILIRDNPSLINVTGLSNVNSLLNLEVYNNETLSACCFLAALIPLTQFDLSIYNNAPGCNNLSEILFPICDDNNDGTDDSFDNIACTCVFTPNGCTDDCQLTTEVVTNGICEIIEPSCDDNDPTTANIFDAENCICVNTPFSVLCENTSLQLLTTDPDCSDLENGSIQTNLNDPDNNELNFITGAEITTLDGIGDFEDFNGDNYLDYISVGPGTENRAITIFLNDGAGNFNSGMTLLGLSYHLVDYDDDNDLDIFLGKFGESDQLFFNDGTGLFIDSGLSIGDDENTIVSDIADIDGDGDKDIVTGVGELSFGGSAKIKILINDGNDQFSPSSQEFSGVLPFPFSDLVIFDFNNDGDKDIVFATPSAGFITPEESNGVRTLINDGNSNFSIGQTFRSARQLTIGDINNDGFLDFAAVGRYGNYTVLNNGDDSFTDPSYFGGGQPTPRGTIWFDANGVSLADVNLDGNLDVLFGVVDEVGNANAKSLYLGEGDGTFVGSNLISLVEWELSFRSFVKDIDRDGDLDLLYNAQSGDVKTLLNTIADGLTYSWNTTPIQTTANIANLEAGTYTLTVTNTQGCLLIDSVTLVAPPSSVASCDDNDPTTANLFDEENCTCSNPPLSEVCENFSSVFTTSDPTCDGNDNGTIQAIIQDPDNSTLNFQTALDPTIGLTTFGKKDFVDLDLDGDLDLIVSRSLSGPQQDKSVVVFLNDGTNNFSLTFEKLGISHSLIDWDNDGDLDIYIGKEFAKDELYFNDRNGTFTDSCLKIGPSTSTHHSEIADLDGDMDLDIAVADNDGNPVKVRFLINDGNDVFTESDQTFVPPFFDLASGITDLLLFDFSNDGKKDILWLQGAFLTESGGTRINNGAGDFSTIGPRLQSGNTIKTGDLNNDGIEDLVIASGDGNSTILNNGDGTFGTRFNFGLPVNVPGPFTPGYLLDDRFGASDVSLADADQDGDLDVFFGVVNEDEETESYSLWLNQGDSTFVGSSLIGQLALASSSASSAKDIDRDGDIDLFYFTNTTGTFELESLENTLNDSLSYFWNTTPQQTTNNLIDLAPGTYTLTVTNNIGCEIIDSVTLIAPTPFTGNCDDNDPNTVDFFDSNICACVHDCGDIEIAFNSTDVTCSNGSNGTAYAIVNSNQTLKFSLEDQILLGTFEHILIDVDQDNDLDAVIGGTFGIKILLNDGTGHFIENNTLAGVDIVEKMISADFDKDGDNDLFIGQINENLVFFNDGTGNFIDSGNLYGTTGSGPPNLDFGDVDADGDIDVISSTSNQEINLWLNNGDGDFTLNTQNVFEGSPVSIKFADVNNNGNLDILYAASFNGQFPTTRVLFNDGAGVFTYTGQSFGVFDKMQVADLDGNGTNDLVLQWFEEVQVYMNDGTGIFTQVANPFPPLDGFTNYLNFPVGNIAITDIDNDLDNDIAFSFSNAQFISVPTTLFLNDGTGSFTAAGTLLRNDLDNSNGSILNGDLDNDGDQDFLYQSSNGNIGVAFNNKTDQINYEWNTNPIQTGASIFNQPMGTYEVTITRGDLCNFTETVTIGEASVPPTCDDNNPNTVDSIDPTTCTCIYTAVATCNDDCDLTIDVLVNGICESTAPSCDDGCDLTTDSFDATNCACINTDPNPDDGCDLTIDSFDETTCTIINEQPTCDDDDPNTNDSFDPTNCECINETIVCDDGCPLTTDILVNGICESTAPSCDDGCDLTTDSFDATNCACINTAPNPDDGCDLTIDSFDEITCTIINEQPTCNDNDPNTNDSFDPTNCECINEAIVCDDGCPLTIDVLVNGICESTAPSCDDGCELTIDSFDATNCACINTAPNPDDGCDLTIDSFDETTCTIINEQPTCNDNNPNTNDSFDPTNCECINEAILCDDGCPLTIDVLTNGICESTAPSCDDGCDLTTDSFDATNCACINTDPNPDDGCDLTIDSFDETTCTIINEQPTCDDDDPNTNDSFDPTNCECINETIVCDDGCPLTTDILVNGICESTAPSCDDGCDLTTDSFDATNCACINTAPNPDDGCDLTIDSFDETTCTIINQQPTCNDNDPCTTDNFDSNSCLCVNTPIPDCGTDCSDFDISVIATDESCIDAADGSIELTATCLIEGTGTTNLALNKTATQSSINGGAIASRAVDGNTNGNWFSQFSVSSTTWTNQAWWEVDLNAVKNINEIEIWGRTDCCQSFVQNYYVLVSENPFGTDNLNDLLARPDVDNYFQSNTPANPTLVPVNLSGRYVRIQLEGTAQLQLAEVKVIGGGGNGCVFNYDWDNNIGSVEDPSNLMAGIYTVTVTDQNLCSETTNVIINEGSEVCPDGCTNTENIALDKPSTQSSTAQGGIAERANDGNTNGAFYSDFSVSLTAWETNAWWEVDLESISNIETINIWNRTDVNSNFLVNFYVLVSDNPFVSTDLGDVLAQAGVSSYLVNSVAGTPTAINIDETGRYVRIQLVEMSFLGLAEVEVIGCSDSNPPDPTCFDNIQNGDETGIDCGGSFCAPCCLPAGTTCDDGDPNTENDQEDGNCNCVGTPIGNCTTPINLAPMGSATQSSTQQGGVAERANDGNTNGSFYSAFSVSLTAWEANAWWELDLGVDATIETINIWNRTDVNTQFLSDYYVLVSSTPFESDDLTMTLNQPGVSSYLETAIAGRPTAVNIDQAGRYVRIQLNGSAFLSLAEVEVMGCPITQNYVGNENDLNHFNALKNGRKVHLNWITNTEFKNDYFVVEHSTNGRDFEMIAEQNSISEGILPVVYQDEHLEPKPGTNFYRLKQFYIDGTFIYTPIRQVDFELDIKKFLVFPNPADEELFIALKDFENEKIELQIYNSLGQPVYRKLINEVPSEPIRFDLKNYSSGIYTLTIKAENRKLIAKKFIISKL